MCFWLGYTGNLLVSRILVLTWRDCCQRKNPLRTFEVKIRPQIQTSLYLFADAVPQQHWRLNVSVCADQAAEGRLGPQPVVLDHTSGFEGLLFVDDDLLGVSWCLIVSDLCSRDLWNLICVSIKWFNISDLRSSATATSAPSEPPRVCIKVSVLSDKPVWADLTDGETRWECLWSN